MPNITITPTELNNNFVEAKKLLDKDLGDLVSYQMTRQITKWVNNRLIDAMDAMGLWTAHGGVKFSYVLDDITYDPDTKDIKQWKFVDAYGAGTEIFISSPKNIGDAFIERETPIETNRETLAALDITVDNKAPTAVTKTISRAVEVALEESAQTTNELHFDVNASLQTGFTGTESNTGATLLATLSSNIGGSRQKTVGEGKSNTTTKYLSDNVIVPGYSRMRIVGTYDKVKLEIPYKIRLPFDFGIEIYNWRITDSGHDRFNAVNNAQVNTEKFNNVDSFDENPRRFKFESIGEMASYMKKTIMFVPEVVKDDATYGDGHLSQFLEGTSLHALGYNTDLNPEHSLERDVADLMAEDRLATFFAHELSTTDLKKLYSAADALKHDAEDAELFLEKRGVFVYDDATDVSTTSTILGTYPGTPVESDYSSYNSGEDTDEASWSGNPVA